MASKAFSRNRQRPDYYAILGVTPGAPFREIEAAYWACAKDGNRDQLVLVNEAYEVLGHTERRAAYDARYVPAEEPPQTSQDDEPRGNGLASKLRWHL